MKLSNRCLQLTVAILVSVSSRLEAQSNYGDALGKSIIAAQIDKDERKAWRPVAYPTDNFGVGTLYDGKGTGSFLCATATCLGLTDNTTKALVAGGYIDSGTGGSINLDDTQKRALGLNAVVKLFSLVGLSGKFDSSKSAIVSVETPSATIRRLIKGKLTAQLTAHPPTSAVTDALANRRIRAVIADIVVESLTATVKLDDSTSADIKASLDQNAGKVLGKDSSFEVTYSKSGQGTYKLQTTHPVIVAVALVSQPKQGELSADQSTDWKQWPPDTALRIK